VQAAEAMLVAVDPWDTDGARRAGLSSAWVNRTEADYPSYFRAPSLEVGSLVDLVDRLS
jgi:2-haloacid dehalogenase